MSTKAASRIINTDLVCVNTAGIVLMMYSDCKGILITVLSDVHAVSYACCILNSNSYAMSYFFYTVLMTIHVRFVYVFACCTLRPKRPLMDRES